jgi:hypothetical protein
MLPQSVRNDQDVGKKDRPVEPEAFDRLQGHFAGRFAIVGEFEEAALLSAQFAIFGQVAPRLAHEPDGRTGPAFSVQSIEQETGHRVGPIQ